MTWWERIVSLLTGTKPATTPDGMTAIGGPGVEHLTREFIRDKWRDGLTAANISALLIADMTTVRPISKQALADYLMRSGLDERITDAAISGALPTELRAGISRLLRFLTWKDSIETTEPSLGAEMAEVIYGMVRANVLTADEASRLYALAGGLRYSSLTEAEVEPIIASLAKEQSVVLVRKAAAKANDAVTAAINSGETSAAALCAVYAEAFKR